MLTGSSIQLSEPGGMELALVLILLALLFGLNSLNKIGPIIRTLTGSRGGLIGKDPIEATRQNLLDYDDTDFEQLVADVWQNKGYSTHMTGSGADQGVDVIANRESETVVIEAKRYGPGNRVSAPTIQKAVGAREQFKADRAVVVTSTEFTQPAEEAAIETEVDIVDGYTLANEINRIAEGSS